jgi:hypothetical protein
VRGQAQTFGGFKPINGIPILLLIGSPTVNTDKNMLIYMIASIIFVTIPLIGLNPPNVCACPRTGHELINKAFR